VRGETQGQAAALRGEIKALQREMSLRFDSLQRTMIQFGGLMVVALIVFIATQG